jgi:hypothetical protein
MPVAREQRGERYMRGECGLYNNGSGKYVCAGISIESSSSSSSSRGTATYTCAGICIESSSRRRRGTGQSGREAQWLPSPMGASGELIT